MKKMKKSGKASETVAEVAEADDLATIAESIKKESAVPKSVIKSAEMPTDAGLFEGLLKQMPIGRLNLGISDFVRKHFKQIAFVRDKSYSWKQIAEVVQEHIRGQSRNLSHSLSDAFFRERHRGDL